MKTAIIENGLFEVNDIGEVYRISDGKKELAVQAKTGRNGRYRVVSAMIDGKQKNFYVHRLIAEAFIPNPDDKPEVNHIDGNPANNRVENLEWVTRSENASHAYRTGLINPYANAVPCKRCNYPTTAKDGLCAVCKHELKRAAARLNRIAKIRDSVADIDIDNVSDKTALYIELRKRGMTFKEISEALGVSRQCVNEAVKKAEARYSRETKPNAQTKKEAERLKRKLNKNALKIADAKALIGSIEAENAAITQHIESLLGTQHDQATA